MNKFAIASVAIAALAAGIFFGTQQSAPDLSELSGFSFPEPEALENVALVDHNSEPLTEADFKDKWTFIYVGYTFCPDYCPLTLTTLNQMDSLLQEDESLPESRNLLVSVDPERDTPEHLKDYVKFFSENFDGATGTPEELRKFADQRLPSIGSTLRFTLTSPDFQFSGCDMLVKDLQTFVVGNPPPHKGGRYFIFVKLTTDDGITGIGEVYNATFAPAVVEHMIDDVFSAHVENTDPFQIETLWRNVYGRGYSMRPDISLMGVLSGLETALWDIIGKSTGKPVYSLLGGCVHEKIRTYTYLYPPGDVSANTAHPVYSDPDVAAARALEYVDQGFTAVKFDPAGAYTTFDPHQPDLESIRRSEQFVKTIREAVGTRADLLFGTHGQFTTSGAIRLAAVLESSDPLWFEEPVPPERPEEMHLHLAACSPNFLILESIENWTGFHNDLLTSPINWQDGYILPPTEPGLGIELNESVALSHPYEGEQLHLEPQASPYLPYF